MGAMEKSGSKSFEMKGICPFLRDSTSKAVTVTASIVEKKFTTKLAGIRHEVPRKDWDEFKDYRVRFWKAGKIWAGAEDKKDDKKDKCFPLLPPRDFRPPPSRPLWRAA